MASRRFSAWDRRRVLKETAARVFLLATAFVPVILISDFFFPYVTTRNIVFRGCVLGALGLFILSPDGRVKGVFRRDPIIKWLLIYLAAISVSALFGASPWHSYVGDFERMGGVIAWVALALFYLLLRVFMNARWWRLFCRLVLLVGDAGILLAVGGAPPKSAAQFAVTMAAGGLIGNPGLLAPYLVFVLTLAAYLAMAERGRILRAFTAVSGVLALTGIAFTANRSSELGLLTGILVAALMFLVMSPRKRDLVKVYALTAVTAVAITVAGILVIQRRAPAVSQELLYKWRALAQSPVDESRTIEWKIALQGFADRPILGYGPENHQVMRSVHFDPRVYEIDTGTPFDRAHNAWLELMGTGGIISALAMLGVWVSSFTTIRRGVRDRTLTAGEASLFTGALTAYAVYLTFWFFDLNAVMLWIALLALLVHRVYGRLPNPALAQPPRRLKWPILVAAEAGIALALYWVCIAPLSAARDLNSGLQSYGTVEDHLESFYKAMDSPAPQTFHTLEFFNAYLGALIPVAGTQKSSPQLRREMSDAFSRGFVEARRTIERDPEDDRVYIEKAKLQKFAGDFTGDRRYYSAAIQTLGTALAMSPKRSESRVILAEIDLAAGDTTGAIAQLETASRIAPRYSIPYARLARLALERRDPEYAAAVLARGLKNGYVDATINYLALERALSRSGKPVPLLVRLQASRDSIALLKQISGNGLQNQL